MRKSSTIPSGKIIPPSERRSPYKAQSKPPIRRLKKKYCSDCKNHVRGNIWDIDFCKWSKKLCKDTRKNGNLSIINCKGYCEKVLNTLDN